MAPTSQNEIEVFNGALDLPVGERAAYLDRACAGNAALRLGVEALLRADDTAGSFLENPLLVAPADHRQAPPDLIAEAEMGECIGRYQVVQQLGEGGCGVVYRALQAEPVQREVALKVIKLGMDTKNVIARFEAERQALALMEHPNIAKVFDAGVTESGRPYFVMELVRGVKITDFCDENQLATPERLALFVQVCRAVQHAHQKGIIHRDIKPSNILVASHDGVPVCKVIDFGIAKATQGKLADYTVFTAFEQFVGTPAYMSPEQAELGAVEIDTRSDIYSLGVLLYELLTGQTPFETQMPRAAGWDEIRRTIREREPVRPSTRLNAMERPTLLATAKRRKAEPPKLIHLVRGDLDWIVMKALDKQRDRRYETANGLAMDIQRHLNNEPVLARPPGTFYALQKTVRRHKVAFALGTLALLALLVCLGAAVTALVLINQARKGTVEQLRASYLLQARATRVSGQPGQRFDSLKAVQQAAAIRFGPEIRNEAIADLAVSDLAVAKEIIVKGLARNEQAMVELNLERYAYSETNGEISIRSTADNHRLLVLPAPGFSAKASPHFTDDGRYLSARYAHEPEGESDWVWDVEQQKVLLRVAQPKGVTNGLSYFFADDFSDDGRLYFSSHPDGSISVYELPGGREVRHFPGSNCFSHLVADPAGRRLACGSREDPRVEIRDLATGRTLLTVTNPAGVSTLAWSADGRRLALAGMDFKIYIRDAATGEPLAVLPGHATFIMSVAFNHAGNRLASSSYDNVLRLWDSASGRELARCSGSSWKLQFSPDDRQLLGWQDISHFGSLTVGDSRECRLLKVPRYADYLSGPAFNPDGRLLAVATGDHGEHDQVCFWDAITGQAIGACPLKAGDSVVFAPDGKSLITMDRSEGVHQRELECLDGTAALHWRLGRPRLLLAASGIQAASLSRDGGHLAVTQPRTGKVFILDMHDLAANVVLSGHPLVDRVALSPDGRWAATGSWNNSAVKIWDARTGDLVRSFSEPGRTQVNFSPDGHWLATSSSEYQLWEVGTWQPRGAPHRAREDAVGCVTAFSPDGRMMARTEADKIELLETATGRPLATLEAPGASMVLNCQFNADGTRLAAVSMDRQLQLWDLRLLREELAQMHMDWEQPPYPPAMSMATTPSATMEIEDAPRSASR